MKPTILALIGNPNSGKSALFNALTGSNQVVGNWPGVTVERCSGRFRWEDTDVTVVDLPGIYSLDAPSGEVAADERVASDCLANEKPFLVNVIDATNLERSLYLTSQLIDTRLPILVVLNKMDRARALGIEIDVDALQTRLGCVVLPTVAIGSVETSALKGALHRQLLQEKPTAGEPFFLGEAVEQALSKTIVHSESFGCSTSRWSGLNKLQRESDSKSVLSSGYTEKESASTTCSGGCMDVTVAEQRYSAINSLVQRVVAAAGESETLSDRIDRWVLHRFFGLPLFFAVMYLLFFFSVTLGGTLVDPVVDLAGVLFVDGSRSLMYALGASEWLIVLLSDGLGAGIQTVVSFIPVIAVLFLFLSLLEDCGYIARAAFVMDRLMRVVGLPGRAFVPMLVGFGCNVPAILATRTLSRVQDRLQTMMMVPFMSCGARLTVYAMFAAVFFHNSGQNVVFALYLAGMLAAVLSGLVFRKVLFGGDPSPLVMELPEYQIPSLKEVFYKVRRRLAAFVVRAGKLILLVVTVLNVLNSPLLEVSDGSSSATPLVIVGKKVAPFFSPMGVTEGNWPAAVGLLTGVLAKEVVAGTMDTLYSSMVTERGPAGVERAKAEKMRSLFDGRASIVAYLLMVLLYTPCVAVLGTIAREAGVGYSLLAGGWGMLLGYGSATIVYQGSRLLTDTLSSVTWIGSVVAVMALFLFLLGRFFRYRDSGIIAVSQG